MAFSPFSQIVQPAPWVDPINLDLLRQGNMYKEEIARQNLSNLSESVQALASTPAYGKDAEKLQEKMEELKSQISGLNLSDVSDYNTMGQIKGVINQFSNDTDMLAIGKRGNFYKSELQKEQQYNEKGLKYRSPSKKSLEEYYNSGIYATNPESVTFSSGWQMPDQAKIMKAAKDLVEPEITFITDAQGRRQEVKRYNPEDLKLAIEQVSNSDPNYEKELSYQFQEQYGDTDWDTYSKEEHSTLVSEAAKNKEIATAFYQKTKDSKYLQMIEQADDVINTFSDAYDNPNSSEQTKIRVFQDFKNKQIYQAISAMDAEQKKPIAMDEIAKAKMDLSNDWQKIQWQAEKEIAVAKKKAELGIGTGAGGDYLVRPDYDAFQNTIASAQSRMINDYKATGDEIQNIGDYVGEDPTYLEGRKIINFTSLPSNIQNIFLDFDAVKGSLKQGEKISGIVVDESDPTNKKYIPVISNNQGSSFKIAKSGNQDVVVDDNSIKLKAQQVKEEKIPGKNFPKSTTETSKLKTITLDTGYVIPQDTVEAIRSQLLSLGKDTSDASVAKIYKKKFTSR